jgi:sortase B
MEKNIHTALIVVLSMMIIISLSVAGWKVLSDWKASVDFDKTRELVFSTEEDEDEDKQFLVRKAHGVMAYQPPETLLNLMAENPDVKGWIKIDGTMIDYPIMLNDSDGNYYLYRDMDGKSSTSGSIFMELGQDLDAYAFHCLYGHHMKNGSMFKDLDNYYDKKTSGLNEDYAKEHSDITVMTGTTLMKLTPVACYQGVEDSDYFTVISGQTAAGAFLSSKTGKSLPEGNYFVLVTCAYYTTNARTYLVCREVERYQ